MSFWKKREVPPETGAVPAETQDTGTAADVEAVMKKYDRESNVRVWEGIPYWVVKFAMIAFSCFCI